LYLVNMVNNNTGYNVVNIQSSALVFHYQHLNISH